MQKVSKYFNYNEYMKSLHEKMGNFNVSTDKHRDNSINFNSNVYREVDVFAKKMNFREVS